MWYEVEACQKMLLTEEEIDEVWDTLGRCTWGEYARGIAVAQLKKVVDWGDEICTCKGAYLFIRRHQCEECWDKLKGEL